MSLNVNEMLLLCAFHSGTFSETVELLRGAAAERTDKKTDRSEQVRNLLAKLESISPGDTVSLYFEPER